MPLPLVAIVGVPNVGKSTLFNRLVRRPQAIVTDVPGTTRDRLYGVVADAPRPFRLVDTGGLAPGTDAPYAREVEQQAATALAEASLVLFVVDPRAGLTASDRDLAQALRRRGGPLLIVANKVDTERIVAEAQTLHELGLGTPLAVSAEHGLGIDELLDAIAQALGPPDREDELPPAGDEVRVAIVGRPNVGKSSLFNRLIGEERAIVSEVPGTTRDAIDTTLVLEERRYRLIDTAGLGRPGRMRERVTRFSSQRARQSIERCDVAVLVLDATMELLAQDAHIAGHVLEAHRPFVVVLNKWDQVTEREAVAKRWADLVQQRLRFAPGVPLLLVSALTGQRVARVLPEVDRLYAAAGLRVSTPELNRWLHSLAEGDPASPPPRRNLRLLYATQTGVHPPTFLIFCNDPQRVHFSMRRRLHNGLRERFGFGAAPLRLRFRARRERARG